MSAARNRFDALERLEAVAYLAEHLAPAFRDKFDFSNPDAKPNDFDRLAEISFQAAEALHRKRTAVKAEIETKYSAELAEELKSEQAKIAKEEGRK